MKKILLLFIVSCFIACNKEIENCDVISPVLNYKKISADAKKLAHPYDEDNFSNIFDNSDYIPTDNSFNTFIDTYKKVLKKDSEQIVKNNKLKNVTINKKNTVNLSLFSIINISFEKKIIKEFIDLNYNLKEINHASEYDEKVKKTKCSQINCRVWVRINKSTQRLALYIDGQVVDTYKVSTGTSKYETPLMNRRPSGPTFTKYTSRKFPGGNYNGLGNMPYVVFIRGGYGIHGTTQGNIPKLGNKASHGCIRVHPENAKILFELIRNAGMENTWVTIEN